jgi:hypothetical protein
LEKVNNEFPTDRVEGLANIELEEERRCFVLVEAFGEVSHIDEVVVNAPLLDESTLGVGDEVVHQRA